MLTEVIMLLINIFLLFWLFLMRGFLLICSQSSTIDCSVWRMQEKVPDGGNQQQSMNLEPVTIDQQTTEFHQNTEVEGDKESSGRVGAQEEGNQEPTETSTVNISA